MLHSRCTAARQALRLPARIALLLVLLWPLLACAEDKTLAAMLGASAAKLAAEGKPDKAKELCYKALANDEGAADALFELGKIFEKEGHTTAAGDFLVRAARQFAKEETSNPAFASKRLDAERRVKLLNPYALRFADAMTDYAQTLCQICKKSPDSLTAEEALDRMDALHLADVVPPDKLPAIDRPKPPPDKTTAKPKPGPGDNGNFPPPYMPSKKEVVTSVPPEVERTLKTAGWTVITGTWKKKSDNVYEVTDGKLETPKTNGALQVILHKGGTGNIRIMVRNNQGRSSYYYSSSSYYANGYGLAVEGATARMYSASGGYSSSGGVYRSYYERDVPLPAPKNKILIQINEGKLQIFVNDQRVHNSNYTLSKEGPFAIEIDGTWTIESPQAMGQ